MAMLMPPEWTTHDATWMAFPTAAYPGAGVSDDDVWRAWAAVANVAADHEPVHMLVNAAQEKVAAKLLSDAVILHRSEFNDAWLRDTGPTFTVDGDELCAVDWQFNGWGDHTAFSWSLDTHLAATVAALTDATVTSSSLVNEGGGIHIDGRGRVLLTTTVQLDPARNPRWSKDGVEEELNKVLGTDQVIWFDRGLHRDYEANGTRGHVDVFACFTERGEVLLHHQLEKGHPDYSLYADHCEVLENNGLHWHAIPAPTALRDNIGWVDYSYLNHYVLNDAVIMPTFNDANDGLAAELLAEYWPGRTVRAVDARVIFAMGGGVHCITQQQPRIPCLPT
jgi:agmatine deiminase